MSRPWMPLYIADFLKDTMHLGPLEIGSYTLLIMAYWTSGELPQDDRQLARIARMTDREWKSSRVTLAAFFQAGWRHKRIDAELAKAAEVSGRRKANADKRWGKRDANVDANNMQLHTHAGASSQSQSPSCADTPARAREDLDLLENRCRNAAGLAQSPGPGLMNLAPILGLIDGGADLERDILPALRAKPNARASSWGYFVGQIQDFRAQRLAAANPVEPRGPGPPANCRAPPKKSAMQLAHELNARNAHERPDHATTIDLTAEPA